MAGGRAGARGVTVLAIAIVATLAAGVAASATRSTTPTVRAGVLASTLAAGHADAVAARVAPAQRQVLSASRMRTVWDRAEAAVGSLHAVTHAYVMRRQRGGVAELEVLAFARGTGTLSASWEADGITGMLLLVSASTGQSTATTAAVYAQDLVDGRLAQLRQRFTARLAVALPASRLAAVTARAFGGLQQPATVAAVLATPAGGDTVVETYFVFPNGLRRVEVALTPDGSIAGLYVRLL